MPVYINNIASIHAAGSISENCILPASEPDYKSIITNANQRRRMSRIVKMGVACGLECINTIRPQEIEAIITATGLGCLADTEKFINALIDNQEQMLNPTAFIQSTFNTIGAQIALLLQIHAYNMTYVHRGLSFESALLDGIMRIDEGNKHVLIGAIDELTPTSYTIQERLGLLKDTIAGEGAQFFLLSSEKREDTFAEIIGIETFTTPASILEIIERSSSFLSQHKLETKDIDWFVNGKNGNKKQDRIYSELENKLFPQARYTAFKAECGEYQTASSFAVWMAAKTLRNVVQTRYTFIYNHFQGINHSFILLKSV